MADSSSAHVGAAKNPSNDPPSLLGQLFLLLEQSGPLKLSFEDLTGISYDVPDLRLRTDHRIHCGEFCMLAKSTQAGHLGCIRNKLACNRLATRRAEGFRGMCHLGLTEWVEPLTYHGRVLGVFYYGSVLQRGTERAGRRKIEAYARRRGIDATALLAAYARAPRVSAEELERQHTRLKTVVALAGRIIDAHGPPLDRYRTEMSATNFQKVPPLVQAAMRQVQRHYAEPLTVERIAAALKCHPDYLSRVFKQAAHVGLADYILRVRIDHARNLIGTGKLTLGEIAWQVGFQDQSHFNRVFKRLVGVTPGHFSAHPFDRRIDPAPQSETSD